MKRAKPNDGKLPDAARKALAVAAMLCLETNEVELPMLAALGLDTEVLDVLFDRGLLESAGPVLARLAKTADRAALLEELAWSERRRLHERMAGLLAGRADRQGEAARHFLAACKYPEARKLFVRVAEGACAEKRYADALAALDEALRIWPTDEDAGDRLRIVRETVRCARNCARHDIAGRALREILEMASAKKDGVMAIDAHQQLADLAMMEVDYIGVRRHLESAAICAGESSPPGEAARCWLAVASFLADQIRTRDAQAALGKAMKLAGANCEPSLRSELLGYEGLLLAMQGDAAAAHARVEEALAVAVEHQLSEQAAMAYRRRANIREYCSDYAGEREAHLNAIALCRKKGAKDSEQMCLTCLSYVFFRTGEWKRALDTAKKVTADPEAYPALKSGAQGVQALVAAFRGEQRQTAAKLEEAARGLRQYGVLSLDFHLLWAQGYLREFMGEAQSAASIYGRLLDQWEGTDDLHDAVPGTVSAAAFFADLGDGRRVAQATDIMHAIMAVNDNPENRAARLAVLGEAAACAGNCEAAITHLNAARDGYDALSTPIERALVRHRLARVLIRSGREREAMAEREACAGIARALGMRPMLAALEKLGMPAGTEVPVVVHEGALTSRQRDVLRLLASGLTNKEAADRLNLSPRTVEMHVAGLLDRLNCRTRSEAIHRAGEMGLLR